MSTRVSSSPRWPHWTLTSWPLPTWAEGRIAAAPPHAHRELSPGTLALSRGRVGEAGLRDCPALLLLGAGCLKLARILVKTGVIIWGWTQVSLILRCKLRPHSISSSLLFTSRAHRAHKALPACTSAQHKGSIRTSSCRSCTNRVRRGRGAGTRPPRSLRARRGHPAIATSGREPMSRLGGEKGKPSAGGRNADFYQLAGRKRWARTAQRARSAAGARRLLTEWGGAGARHLWRSPAASGASGAPSERRRERRTAAGRGRSRDPGARGAVRARGRKEGPFPRRAHAGARPPAPIPARPPAPPRAGRPPPAPTSVPVGLHAVSVLQPVAPGALVAGRRAEALPHPVAPLETVGPLAAVHPPALRLHAQPVALALRPVAQVGVAAGPGVAARHLEAVGPGAGILALPLGPGANAVPVGFPVLPAAAVGAAIVEVEPAARHPGQRGERGAAAASRPPSSPFPAPPGLPSLPARRPTDSPGAPRDCERSAGRQPAPSPAAAPRRRAAPAPRSSPPARVRPRCGRAAAAGQVRAPRAGWGCPRGRRAWACSSPRRAVAFARPLAPGEVSVCLLLPGKGAPRWSGARSPGRGKPGARKPGRGPRDAREAVVVPCPHLGSGAGCCYTC